MVVENYESEFKYSEGDFENLIRYLYKDKKPAKWVIKSLRKKLDSGEISIKNVYQIMKNEPWYNKLDKVVRADWTNYEFSDELG